MNKNTQNFGFERLDSPNQTTFRPQKRSSDSPLPLRRRLRSSMARKYGAKKHSDGQLVETLTYEEIPPRTNIPHIVVTKPARREEPRHKFTKRLLVVCRNDKKTPTMRCVRHRQSGDYYRLASDSDEDDEPHQHSRPLIPRRPFTPAGRIGKTWLQLKRRFNFLNRRCFS